MENLIATYQDDDEEENAATATPPPTDQDPPPTFQDPSANAESPPSASDDVIVEPVLATELPDTDQKSPSKSTDEDDDDDDEEEEEEEVEEPPVKKQKPLSSLTLSPPNVKEEEEEQEQGEEMTKLTSSKAKSKKKSKGKNNMNNLWTKPNSRKGKKKNNGSSQKSKKNGAVEAAAAAAAAEDKVYITPVPRFPDKNDDTPESKICLSKVYKAEKVDVSEDRLSAGSTKGYRMVRATRGVLEGAWYFEINVVKLGETGHTRLGWSIDKGDLQAPVGYDANSFGYRDIDGSKIHKALREKYGEQGYREGDVIGFYINLPEGQQYAPKPPRLVWYKGQRYMCASDPKEDPPKIIPGSEISFFKNGVCQGVAFKDLFGGRYYPAASMYTLPDQPNCVVRFNFGPDFECFPEDFAGRPMPKPMVEVPFHGFEGRVENGNQWHSTRICPMLKVVKEHENKIGEAAEMAS